MWMPSSTVCRRGDPKNEFDKGENQMDAKKPTVEQLLKKIGAWLGVPSLYLLTTTPEQFFLRRGYARKTP
jgi:hypothetical protein